MRVYVAGPMRGCERLNFPAFDAARDLLAMLGHDPVSPADMDREIGVNEHTTDLPAGFVRDALRRDFGAILGCDAVAFLPGWEASQGARAERAVAEHIGLACWRIDPAAGTFYRESLIGLAGYARSGKNTLAAYIAGLGYEERSFAAPLKGILYSLDPTVALEYGHASVAQLVDAFGWEGAKEYAQVRALLQRLGTEGGRAHLGEDVWVETLFRTPSRGRVVVADVRFPNEADAIRARGGVVVRLVRNGVRPVNGHPSELAMDGYDFDTVIHNDGSPRQLRHAAQTVVDLAHQ